jgi:hypothetical protein
MSYGKEDIIVLGDPMLVGILSQNIELRILSDNAPLQVTSITHLRLP